MTYFCVVQKGLKALNKVSFTETNEYQETRSLQ